MNRMIIGKGCLTTLVTNLPETQMLSGKLVLGHLVGNFEIDAEHNLVGCGVFLLKDTNDK